jgi:hypothetical protein
MRARGHRERGVSAGLLAVLAVLLAGVGALTWAQTGGQCALTDANSDTMAASSCRKCHPWSACHPVDKDYASASLRKAVPLRPLTDAIRFGAFLPNGEVRCVSCHSRHSTLEFHLAIPATSGPEELSPGRRTVSPSGNRGFKALCLECHPFD